MAARPGAASGAAMTMGPAIAISAQILRGIIETASHYRTANRAVMVRKRPDLAGGTACLCDWPIAPGSFRGPGGMGTTDLAGRPGGRPHGPSFARLWQANRL